MVVISALAADQADKAGKPAVDLAQLPPAASRPVQFKEDIRPIFETHCYKCHGPEKQKSGFRLDIKTAALAGGERGVDIVPGQSAASPLIQFVAGAVEDMQMPPPKSGGRALTSEQIGLLRAWIDQGVIWPEELASQPQLNANRTNFWSFQPVPRPTLPPVDTSGWAHSDLDLFILARLQQEKLKPSPEADRRTLIRRVTFDLTGLPPTPTEVESFLADGRAEAYAELVDRLLSSARYGERWARYWLDTVHYGETHGYDKDKPRPHAWPYRDYVIRSFNQDKPYGRFVEEQLAGDVLHPNDPDGVVALGFLAAGPWDFVGHVELPESKTDGLIARYNDRDDMVMTTMSTFQSLTVHCARCHDHKFDPITQEDYYGLQAIFAGVDRADRWVDSDSVVFQKRKTLLSEKRALEQKLTPVNARVEQVSPAILKLVESRRAELKKDLAALPKTGPDQSPSNGFHSEVSLQPDVTKWVQIDLGRTLPLDEIRLIPARPTDFTDTPGFGFPVRFRVDVADNPEFENPSTLLDRTGADEPNPGDKPVSIPAKGQSARVIRVTGTRLWLRTGDYALALAELQALSGGTNVALSTTVTSSDSIESGRWARAYLVDGFSSRARLETAPSASEQKLANRRSELESDLRQLELERKRLLDLLLDPETKEELARIDSDLKKLETVLGELPAPGTVYAAAHEFSASGSFKPPAQPRAVHVLRRGDVKQPIHPAEPGTVACFTWLRPGFQVSDPQAEGLRRAALARWLTQPSNLLTRRSIVNRVWQYHFGRGIVDTPNDFGHMGALPTHPELLDWLAYWFLDHGESLKELHRLILLSATYRQSSQNNADGARVDADNRFLWRMNRSRLDAEALRDTILSIAGRLDLTMGGPSDQQFFFKDDHSPVYDYSKFDVESPLARRRSIYRFIVRSVPDPLMETLDCPDPSLLSPRRGTTITALQALALLNDPFVLRQAEYFAGQVGRTKHDPGRQIEAVYQTALNRAPSPSEQQRLLDYTRQHGLTNFCRLVFNTSEFMFVD